MSKTGLKIVLSDSVTDTTLRKLEHYYGVTFKVGESNQGGDNGYYELIGNDELRKEMRFHNQMKPCRVKNGEIVEVMDETKWTNYTLDGSDGCDIYICHITDVYAICGAVVDGIEIRAVSDKPFSYEGIEATHYQAYGESPDYDTLLNGVFRSIRNDDVSGTFDSGSGTNYSDSNYGTSDAGGYPMANLNRIEALAYSRAKNEDYTSNFPYTAANNIDRELLETFIFIECRTKVIESLFSYGISNALTPLDTTWGKVSGIRLTVDGTNYTYMNMFNVFYLNGTTQMTIKNIINGGGSLLKIFEPQISVSNGDSLDAIYDSDGNALQSVSDSVMTGIWTKTFSFQVTGSLTRGGTSETYTVEVCLRVPIWRGYTNIIPGNNVHILGYEMIIQNENDSTKYKWYRCPNIDNLTIADNNSVTKSETFAFESVYNFLIEFNSQINTNITGFTKMAVRDGNISTSLGDITELVNSGYDNIHMHLINISSNNTDKRYASSVYFGEFGGNGWGHFRSIITYPSYLNSNTLYSKTRVALNV